MGIFTCKWWDNWCIKPVDMISLSHYLQGSGLGYIQTVVENRISEPSTVPIQCCSLVESWGKSKNGSCCLVYFADKIWTVLSCNIFMYFLVARTVLSFGKVCEKNKRELIVEVLTSGHWACDAQKLEDRLGTTAENGSYAASRKTNLKILFCG